MPQFPHIIQTILPNDRTPENSFVATWIKFDNQKLPDLTTLVSQLSADLRQIPMLNWNRDVIGHPQRLLAAIYTRDLDILRTGNIGADLIDYLNRCALDAAIVVEESPPSWKAFAAVLLTAPVVYIGSLTLGHPVPAEHLTLFVAEETTLLAIMCGLENMGTWAHSLTSWALRRPKPPVPPQQPPPGSTRGMIFPPPASPT